MTVFFFVFLCFFVFRFFVSDVDAGTTQTVADMVLAYSDGVASIQTLVSGLQPFLGGAVGTVDLATISSTTNVLASKSVVVIWSNTPLASNGADIGNALDNFLLRGSGVCVIECVAAFEASSIGVSGLWKSNSDGVFVAGTMAPITNGPLSIGTRQIPSHRILQNITSFTAPTSTNRIVPASLYPSATLIASWSDSSNSLVIPLVAERTTSLGAKVIGLNIYPPHLSFCTGDSYRLLANAMQWCGESVNTATKLVFTSTLSATVNSMSYFTITVALQTFNGSPAALDGIVLTLGFSVNPSNKAIINGVTSVTTSGGLTSFTFNVAVDKIGVGYVLNCTASGFKTAVSTSFNVIVGPATKLQLVSAPTGVFPYSQVFSVQVTSVDAGGNPSIPTAGTIIMVSLGTTTSPVLLSGTRSIDTSTVPGATLFVFPSLSLDAVGSYFLTISSQDGSLASVNSAVFQTSSIYPAKLIYLMQPLSQYLAGDFINITMQLVDENGLGISIAGAISLTIASGTATLQGTSNQSTFASNSVYRFSAISLYQAGASYKISASFTSSTILLSNVSNAFSVSALQPSRLQMSSQPPLSAVSMSPFSLTVQSQDKYGNAVAIAAGKTLTVAFASFANLATLSGSVSTISIGGENSFTFNHLYIDKAGGYVLNASSSDNWFTLTSSITIVAGSPYALSYVTVPGSIIQANYPFTVSVQIQDIGGNPVVSSSSVLITLSLASNPGAAALAGVTLGQTSTTSVIVFSDIVVNRPGTGYVLKAETAGSILWMPAFTAPFDIVVSSGMSLRFLQSPIQVTDGEWFNLTVAVLDQNGAATLTNPGQSLSVALYTDPSAGVAKVLGTLTKVTTSTAFSYTFTVAIDYPWAGFVFRAVLLEANFLALSSPITVVPGVCTMQNNIRYTGGTNLLQSVVTQSTLCCVACRKVAKCTHWVWDGQKTCLVIQNAAASTNVSGYISGLRDASGAIIPLPASSSTSSNDLSSLAIALIVVGTVGGALLLLVLCCFYAALVRKQKTGETQLNTTAGSSVFASPTKYSPGAGSYMQSQTMQSPINTIPQPNFIAAHKELDYAVYDTTGITLQNQF